MNIHQSQIFVKKIEGKGNLNFVLIHNAGGDHRFFTPQIKTLKNHGNVIQFDLPGHGKSDVISRYKMEDLASVVVQVCENLGLKNLCFIGLNNGANIVIDILNNYPSLIIKNAVLIDPPIFINKIFEDEINSFIQELENSKKEDFSGSLVDNLFIHTTASNKKIARSAFNKADKKSLQNIFRSLIEWDKNSHNILKKIDCPCLCILTDEHHCSYKKLSEEAPHIEIAKVIGSKCWATLEVPQQVNAIIERFLKIYN